MWNQVTHDEILKGHRRSRLSCAVSKNDGKTWEHFKTLDCADPLDSTQHEFKPDRDPQFVIAVKDCGEMPANYCVFRYANIRFTNDMAYIFYDRETFSYPGAPRRVRIMRAIPIDTLYDDSKADMRLSNEIPKDITAAIHETIED